MALGHKGVSIDSNLQDSSRPSSDPKLWQRRQHASHHPNNLPHLPRPQSHSSLHARRLDTDVPHNSCQIPECRRQSRPHSSPQHNYAHTIHRKPCLPTFGSTSTRPALRTILQLQKDCLQGNIQVPTGLLLALHGLDTQPVRSVVVDILAWMDHISGAMDVVFLVARHAIGWKKAMIGAHSGWVF